jgi:hypothetical protein
MYYGIICCLYCRLLRGLFMCTCFSHLHLIIQVPKHIKPHMIFTLKKIINFSKVFVIFVCILYMLWHNLWLQCETNPSCVFKQKTHYVITSYITVCKNYVFLIIIKIYLIHVRFQVLMTASMKFRVFWDVAPCSHVEVDWLFWGAYCLHHQGALMHHWKVGQLRRDYTALHPRRL